jgi:hypothetical protein
MISGDEPDPGTQRARASWEPPSIKSVGTIPQVVKGGGGKLSPTGGDPGEGRKERRTG